MQTLRSIIVFLITLSLLASTPAVVFAQGEVFLEDKPDEVVLEITEGSGEENTSLFSDETEINEPPKDEDAAVENGDDEGGQQAADGDEFSDISPTSLEGVPVETPELTADEFRELLIQNDGGVITLTGNVVWDDYWQDITIEHPTTVLMGDYGIKIPSYTTFKTAGPLRFEGKGVERPLFYIGADAIFSAEGAEIAALGDGATAVYAEGILDLTLLKVSAEGYGSVGIHGDIVHLSLCVVTASGLSVISEAGDVRLNGCRVNPMPEGVNVTTREAVPGGRIQENGISITVGDTFDEALNNNRWADYYLLDTERRIATGGYMFPALWENLPPDTSTAGEYTVLCVPMGVPDWLPVDGMTAFEVPLHIVAENQPHIESAARFWEMVMLRFFNEIEDYENLTLWYSTDNGQTWLDFEQLSGAQLSPYGASVDSLPANRVYLFKLEVTGGSMAGFSNVLVFPFYDSDPDSEGGGDRTGADRFPLGGTDDQSNNNLGGSNLSGNNPNDDAEDDNNPEVDNPGAGTGGSLKPETGGNPGNNPNITDPKTETEESPDSEPSEVNHEPKTDIADDPVVGQIENSESGILDNKADDDSHADIGASESVPDSNTKTPVSNSEADKNNTVEGSVQISNNSSQDEGYIASAMQDNHADIDTNTDAIPVLENITKSIDSEDVAIEPADSVEQTVTRLQPPVPQPSFSTVTAAGILGGVVILTVGAASLIRIRRSGRMKNGKRATKKSI